MNNSKQQPLLDLIEEYADAHHSKGGWSQATIDAKERMTKALELATADKTPADIVEAFTRAVSGPHLASAPKHVATVVEERTPDYVRWYAKLEPAGSALPVGTKLYL